MPGEGRSTNKAMMSIQVPRRVMLAQNRSHLSIPIRNEGVGEFISLSHWLKGTGVGHMGQSQSCSSK